MRASILGLSLIIAAGTPRVSEAVVPSPFADRATVVAGPSRIQRTTSVKQRLDHLGLTGWSAIWDDDTNVPLRMWGPSPVVRGSVADPAIAEAAARQFLAAHIATLAPGASPADFELVSNQLSRNRDIRSIGFVQRANGMRVVGGAIGFSFKRDRLTLVNSTALPNVKVVRPAQRLAATKLEAGALGWLASAGYRVAANRRYAAATAEPVIFPIVNRRTGAGLAVSYRVAEQLVVDATSEPGSWDVWVDAATAAPIARKSRILFGTGAVKFRTPDRYPGAGRSPKPAPQVNVVVDGLATTSALDGSVGWSGAAAALVSPSVIGPLVGVYDYFGSQATTSLQLSDGGELSWDEASNEIADAQLAAFIETTTAKRFAKTRIDPNLAWLDRPIIVSTNEPGTCNAYSDGDNIFFLARGECENTALLADVVYHEFGHSLHYQSVIAGVGVFDAAVSEGISDFYSALLTKDAKMGPGFYFSTTPVRDLDPVGIEKRWPDDATGEPHDDGEILGGAMWDTWKALEQTLGTDAAYEKIIDYYTAVIQRSTDIPSVYAEVLLADDDDGDLSNGTPNECLIAAQFDKHGLRVAGGVPIEVTRDGQTISISAETIGSPNCPAAGVASAMLDWNVRGQPGTSVAFVDNGGTFSATLPAQPDGTLVQYTLRVVDDHGGIRTFPSNPAEPYYEQYFGPLEPLWCSNFDAGLGEMTTTGGSWEVGEPHGMAGDPLTAASGHSVLGTDLSQNGAYDYETASASTPEVLTLGRTNVRLQFKRWLTVADAYYDRAAIFANDAEVWTNHGYGIDDEFYFDHLDREWTFRDIDLTPFVQGGKVQVTFDLNGYYASDWYGGWNLDDICIMAAPAPARPPGPRCGNNIVEDGEVCDDGNRVNHDGCNAFCNDEIDETPPLPDTSDSGGCAAGGNANGLALGLMTVGALIVRRRRTRA
ncbi:MAG: hypothetical protein AB7O24_15560 [Kofleriaceae bacterium]